MPAQTTRYDDLPDDEQVEILRPVATAGCAQLGLEVLRLEPVAHLFNTTFAADTPEGRVAVRVLTNSMSSDEHVEAQIAWADAISRETGVRVPAPVPGPDGQHIVRVPAPAVGRDLRVTASRWVEGEHVDHLDSTHARLLGETIGVLHEHASTWSMPSGASLPLIDDPLRGEPDRLSAAISDPADAAVVAEAYRRARAAHAAAEASDRPIPLHSDLHEANLLWGDGGPAVLDLDDAGIGVPAHDLAVATFYLRRSIDAAAPGALMAGYSAHRSLPAVDSETFEGLVAGRQLLLTCSLLGTTTASLRGEIAGYLETTLTRLRHWLDEGVLDTRVVGG